MSSSSNQNPNLWSPYKDCSQGVCSIYCPQWCYIIFPPPPPSGDSSSVTDLSPLVIAVIGILASACILVSYYAFVSRYCKRRPAAEADAFHSQPPVSAGLDESVIKTIAVCRYQKTDGFADCSVCLSEFVEGETLRLLPKCRHAFHLPCIDPWLKNQASCPLCRSDPLPVETVVQIEIDHLGLEAEQSGSRGLRRSLSLDSAARQEARVRISDILEASDDEYVGVECGSSRDKSGGVNMAAMMKRSTSTGRFTFSRSGKGRSSSSIHP